MTERGPDEKGINWRERGWKGRDGGARLKKREVGVGRERGKG